MADSIRIQLEGKDDKDPHSPTNRLPKDIKIPYVFPWDAGGIDHVYLGLSEAFL